MANKPSQPNPPDKKDFQNLNESIKSLSADFENYTGASEAKPFKEELDTRNFIFSVNNLTKALKDSTRVASTGAKGVGGYVSGSTRDLRNDMKVDKSTLAGRSLSTINPLLGYAADSVLGSEATKRLVQSSKEQISKTTMALRSSERVKKMDSQKAKRDRILSNRNEGTLRDAEINSILQSPKPKKGRYPVNVTNKALDYVKSPDTTTAIDRLRLTQTRRDNDSVVSNTSPTAISSSKRISASYSSNDNLQISQLEALEEIKLALTDPDATKTGPFAMLSGAAEMLVGPIFSGKYKNDIFRSSNPFITMTSAAIEQYRWQRLYGELQYRQMNELIKMSYGAGQPGAKPQLYDVFGRRGVLLEWMSKKARSMSERYKELEGKRKLTRTEKITKKVFGIANSIQDWFDDQTWDTQMRVKQRQTLENVSVGIGSLKDLFNLNTEGVDIGGVGQINPELTDGMDFDEWNLTRSRNKRSTLRNQLRQKKAANLRRQRRARDGTSTLTDHLSGLFGSRNVNDYEGTPGSTDSIITKDGKVLRPSDTDVVSASAKGKKSQTESLLSKILSVMKDTKLYQKTNLELSKISESRQQKVLRNEAEKAKKEKEEERRVSKIQSLKEKGKKGFDGLLEFGGMIAKLGIGGILTLGTLLTLLVKYPKRALEGLKWSFQSTENFAKMGWMFGKVVTVASTAYKMLSTSLGAVINASKSFVGFFKGIFGKTVMKEGAELAAKKGGGKLLSKGALKVLAKKIPFVSLVAGIAFAINRFSKGDVVGGLGELASGIASSFPGPGTIISLIIDGLLIAKDVKKLKNPNAKPKGVMEFFSSILVYTWKAITAIPKKLGEAVMNIGKTAITKVIPWIIKRGIDLMAYVTKGILNAALLPYKITKRFGEWLSEKGIQFFNWAKKAIPNIISSALEFLQTLKTKEFWKGVLDSAITGLVNLSNKAKEVLENTAKNVINSVKGFGLMIRDVFLDLVSYLKEKMGDALSPITDIFNPLGKRKNSSGLDSLIKKHGHDNVMPLWKEFNGDASKVDSILSSKNKSVRNALEIQNLIREFGKENVLPLVKKGLTVAQIKNALGVEKNSGGNILKKSDEEIQKIISKNNTKIERYKSEIERIRTQNNGRETMMSKNTINDYERQINSLSEKNTKLQTSMIGDGDFGPGVIKFLVDKYDRKIKLDKKDSVFASNKLEFGSLKNRVEREKRNVRNTVENIKKFKAIDILKAVEQSKDPKQILEEIDETGYSKKVMDVISSKVKNDNMMQVKASKKLDKSIEESRDSEHRINNIVNNAVKNVTNTTIQSSSSGSGNQSSDIGSLLWRNLDSITTGSAI